ncbi:hypothetical protein BDY24DRAFT_441625 [Mrakia frigida]|uniref:uncharacterized protein n=1 Tax=Mrakia frigida TaxID=29902 RepID=UPI003FCC22F7
MSSTSSSSKLTPVYIVFITTIENFLGEADDRRHGHPQTPIPFRVFLSLNEANEEAKFALVSYLGECEPEEEDDLTEDGCYVPNVCLPEGVSMEVGTGGEISIFCVPEDGYTAYEVTVVQSTLVNPEKVEGDEGKSTFQKRQDVLNALEPYFPVHAPAAK